MQQLKREDTQITDSVQTCDRSLPGKTDNNATVETPPICGNTECICCASGIVKAYQLRELGNEMAAQLDEYQETIKGLIYELRELGRRLYEAEGGAQ